jgi:hypothetical protein
LTRGWTERRVAPPRPSRAPLRSSIEMSASLDPSWHGIIETLVWDLGGAVRWENDSVVLQLPDLPHANRVADLDALKLCLAWIGLPVVFDASRVIFPDHSLADFLRKMVESGLMKDDRVAA